MPSLSTILDREGPICSTIRPSSWCDVAQYLDVWDELLRLCLAESLVLIPELIDIVSVRVPVKLSWLQLCHPSPSRH